jgi:hypothetical protein
LSPPLSLQRTNLFSIIDIGTITFQSQLGTDTTETFGAWLSGSLVLSRLPCHYFYPRSTGNRHKAHQSAIHLHSPLSCQRKSSVWGDYRRQLDILGNHLLLSVSILTESRHARLNQQRCNHVMQSHGAVHVIFIILCALKQISCAIGNNPYCCNGSLRLGAPGCARPSLSNSKSHGMFIELH